MIKMIKNQRKGIKRCWAYTKSINLCLRVFYICILGAFAKIFGGFFHKIFRKALENTNKEYIFNTNFGKFLCGDFDSYLHINENYEPEIQKVINDIVSKNGKDKNSYFINIGCHIGFYAILLANKFGCNVIGFEPNPRTFYYLRCNVSLSNLDDKIQLYNIGLGNQNSKLKFATGIGCSGMAHIINDISNEKQHNLGKIIDINVKKFDDLGIDKDKIDKTRLIIIDVEGFELNVLKGMENTLKKLHNCNIIIEIRKDNINKKKTLDLMESLGFSPSQIDDDNRLFKK